MAGIWRKTLTYLGLVEEDEFDDYDGYDGYEDLMEDPEPAPRRQAIRRVEEHGRGGRRSRSTSREEFGAVVHAMPEPRNEPRVHHLEPTNFGTHAQELGDKFREGSIVFMNLQSADEDTKSRLKNFASGLVYGLEGRMRQLGSDMFLLTPKGTQVSAEEQQKLLEERGLFYQA